MSELPVTNWAGNVVYEAGDRVAATSVEQVQVVVRCASERGQRLRVVGTRHCFNEIADTDGVHVGLRDLPRRIKVGADSVVIDGGATYTEVNRVLAAHGRALANLASLPHITVAGAIATATHGSGDRHPSLASAVRALTHVTADGELHTIRRGDAGFENYPVHLGLFGPVVELELDTVPAFDVATTVYEGLEFDTLVEHLDEMTSELYSFSVAPNWHDGGRALLFAKQVVGERGVDDAGRAGRSHVGGSGADEPGLAGVLTPTERFGARAATRALHPSPGADPVAVTGQFGVAGPSHERLTHFKSEFEPSVGDEVQSEYLVPRRHAREALRRLPQFAPVFARLAHSMEIRSVAADDLSASPFCGTDALAFHMTWRRDPGAVMAELPAVEKALEPFEVRPHWGKLYAMSPRRLRELFPRLADVDAEARRHDPNGLFRNAWTGILLGSG